MSDVQFEEENDLAVRRPASAAKQGGGLTRMIINAKLAKDEKQASQVLIVIGIVCIVLAVAIYFVGHRSSAAPVAPVLTPTAQVQP